MKDKTYGGHQLESNLYLSLVCDGRSLLEYCLERADKSFSPFPLPPLAGSKVGLAAVVIAYSFVSSLVPRSSGARIKIQQKLLPGPT